MKTLLLSLLAGVGTVASASAQAGYTTFIRQSQQTTGVIWDMPIATVTGTSLSPMSLESGGALFQLYTVKTTGAVSYLLDQKLVGAYLPTATVNVVTEDPYVKIKRTRADRPFTLQVNVAGILSGTTASGAALPDAAKKVLVQRFATPYPAGGALTVAQATAGTPLSTFYITTNGTTSTNYTITGIKPTTGQLSTKVTGEEYYVVQALADASIAQSQIAMNYVQIHPVASGAITGIANNYKLSYKAPTIQLVLTDLYPRSDTWLHIYPGTAALGTVGVTVPGSVLVLDQEKVDTRTLTLTDWDSVIKTDGTYTMEILTKTVFGTERLAYVTFTAKRTLSVQGTLADYSK